MATSPPCSVVPYAAHTCESLWRALNASVYKIIIVYTNNEKIFAIVTTIIKYIEKSLSKGIKNQEIILFSLPLKLNDSHARIKLGDYDCVFTIQR